MSRRSLLIFVAVAATLFAVTGVAGALLLGDGAPERPASLRALDLSPCEGLDDERARECFAKRFQMVVDGRDDPRPGVQAISDLATSEGGWVLTNCHVVMHTVGRTYAREESVTLANLMKHLPRSNDPGCSAGFAHGMISEAAGDIDTSRPAEAAGVCSKAATRWQRYSCVHGFGHAFMRLYGDDLPPALELCTALGVDMAPDCAQGAYHDYWFAVVGADDATLRQRAVTSPRRLCASQPKPYVQPCWYRAFLETRPDGFQVEAPRDLQDLCKGLEDVQRAGCVTGAAVIGPSDPAEQLRICAALDATADAESCVRGTKVQNLLDAPAGTYERLIGGCERFAAAARGGCYAWLGKAITVVTDGRFARTGCPKLPSPDARRYCADGARTIDEALVTFS